MTILSKLTKQIAAIVLYSLEYKFQSYLAALLGTQKSKPIGIYLL